MQANKISLMTFTVKEQSAINKRESEDKKCVRSYTSHQALLRMNGHNGSCLMALFSETEMNCFPFTSM